MRGAPHPLIQTPPRPQQHDVYAIIIDILNIISEAMNIKSQPHARYMLELPSELHQRLKIRAAERRLPMKAILTEALERELRNASNGHRRR